MPDADVTEAITDETPIEEQADSEQADDAATADDEPTSEPDAETFPREYVQKLRRESKGYRDRANAAESRVEDLSKRLYSALVAATGRLQDPDDLPYAPELLDDSEALTAAIDDLLDRKPHLASRRVAGPVGQGVTGTREEPFSLLTRLKQSV